MTLKLVAKSSKYIDITNLLLATPVGIDIFFILKYQNTELATNIQNTFLVRLLGPEYLLTNEGSVYIYTNNDSLKSALVEVVLRCIFSGSQSAQYNEITYSVLL
jgi:hypothetical protein